MRKSLGQNLTYSIAEQLGHAVVTQAYSQSVPFPIESELCKQFGASRTVLREAVKMLTAKGLLNSRPRQGTRVQLEQQWNLLDPDVLRWLMERKFSLQLLTEFTQVRQAIEPMAARLAATDATDAAVKSIRDAIDRMHAAAHGDDDPLESDIAFHVAILHATGNRFYSQLEGVTDAALRISIKFTNTYKGVRQADVVAHQRVFDAIAARRPDKAYAAMEGLLAEVMELIGRARRESGTASPPAAANPVANVAALRKSGSKRPRGGKRS